jgi:hypothetical protein
MEAKRRQRRFAAKARQRAYKKEVRNLLASLQSFKSEARSIVKMLRTSTQQEEEWLAHWWQVARPRKPRRVRPPKMGKRKPTWWAPPTRSVFDREKQNRAWARLEKIQPSLVLGDGDSLDLSALVAEGLRQARKASGPVQQGSARRHFRALPKSASPSGERKIKRHFGALSLEKSSGRVRREIVKTERRLGLDDLNLYLVTEAA